jgi:hypothetical protein
MNTKTAEQLGIEKMLEEMGGIAKAAETAQKAAEDQYRQLTANFNGVESKSKELEETVKKHAAEYAETIAAVQQLTSSMELLKKELDAPAFQNEATLKDHDRKAAIELQKRIHCFKGGEEHDFRVDNDNLVKMDDYRSACRKLVATGGKETREKIVKSFTDGEKKAFDAASLDTAFFSPEMLGIEVDCNIECSSLLDLYGQVTVSRSAFMYPQIIDYGAIGSYDCDAKCDAELGPEGNIAYKNGKTFDFRGVFCFQRKVIDEANYDLLGFMMRAAARSYRINRNRVNITGNGVEEPRGWLKTDCFPKLSAAALGGFNHVDFRRFLSTAPIEYGDVTPIMHQNTFGYLASAVDNNGRFIFGDGDLTFSPSSAANRLRISNCLPDPTDDNTLGSADAPFVAGSFIAAAGNWPMAYMAVNKKPMFMEQYIGGSSAWCVKYQFGAEDGGFVACCDAARILVAG